MLRTALCVAVLTASLPAQSIIPAKAGLVSYAGEAYIDGRPVETSSTHFSVMNDNAVLRTGIGRAEVLLGPCSAMWVEQQSALRMVSSALSDVRLVVLHGSVIIATGEMMKGTKVTVMVAAAAAPLEAKGAYRFDADPARVKVMGGKTAVLWENKVIPLTTGRLMLFDSLALPARFDRHNTDSFENWSDGRAEYLEDLSSRQSREIRVPAAPEPPPSSPGWGVHGTVPAVPQPVTVPPAAACTVSGW
ncbi:MAG TPA: hypothetical protein VMB03_28030 [Bryobacteraceae bacterium]|nr:hypothetical protein [Bryobacteraceae bacterium]